jgi:molybdenum cofactor guanylyltransferase
MRACILFMPFRVREADGMRVLGAVMAGGQSRRMGCDKAFVKLDGVSLIERVMSRISFQVAEVVISVKSEGSRFFSLGVPVIEDRFSDTQTPLAGLEAALHHAAEKNFDAVLTVACDTPFLPLDLVERLALAGADTGAAVARSGTQVHYLTGLWSSALAAPLGEILREKRFSRVQDFVAYCKTREVEWLTFPHDPMMNINTPEDLAAAESILHA